MRGQEGGVQKPWMPGKEPRLFPEWSWGAHPCSTHCLPQAALCAHPKCSRGACPPEPAFVTAPALVLLVAGWPFLPRVSVLDKGSLERI